MSTFKFTSIDLISVAGNITEHLLTETGEKTACGFLLSKWKGTSQKTCGNGHCRNCESRVKTMRRMHEVHVPKEWEPMLMKKAILENLNSVEGADGMYNPL